MKETIQNLGEKIDLISVIEPKFKTSGIMMTLLMPVIPEKNSAYSLALSLLTRSCRKYPDNAAMTIKLDTMYGASLGSSISVNGNVHQLFVSGTTIANRYALHGEDLVSELTELMCDCLLDPNAENGAFNASEFRIEMQELLDAIDAEINNKRGYAVLQARRKAFEGEVDAYPAYGTKEDVAKLTPENVYEAYREILRRAVIRIYYVGPEEAPQLAGQLTEALKGLERVTEELVFHAPSPCKPETAYVNEPLDVTQSKLVMVFKAEQINKEALRMLSAVYGGTPYSMLFMNVREKLSLCYYCASRPMLAKDAMIVDSGVELANAERARDAILEQLDIIRSGEFDESLLDNAKQAMVNSLRSIGDSPSSCMMELYERFYTNDDADVETRIQRYLALTKKDLVQAAKRMRLDTVYVMQQEGGAENG